MQASRPALRRGCGRPASVSALPKRCTLPARQVASKQKVFVDQPPRLNQYAAGLPRLPERTVPHAGEGSSDAKLGFWHKDKEYLKTPVRTWKKIIPLALMFFSILFIYTILRDTKDVLVVTAPGSGAEVIPFLKTWVNLPAAFFFTLAYAKAVNFLTLQQLFYGFILPFITFFGLFAYVIYPNASSLHPTEWCVSMLEKYGDRFLGPLAIIRNWTFCLFYVMAELWGSVVVSVLFWGTANEMMTTEEAESWYPFFGLCANVALVFSGQAVRHYSNVRAKLPPGVDGWGVSLRGMMGLVVAFGLAICVLRWIVQKTTFENPEAALPKSRKDKKKKKENMDVGESFAFLARSTYIRCMATLVVCYGVAINIVEVTWKGKLKAQYPDPNDYSQFMGNFSTTTGFVTISLMFLAKLIFKYKSWTFAARIPALMLGGTGLVFFSLLLFGGAVEPLLNSWSMTPLFAAVLVGALQNIFSKGAKYSLFDPCKETAYIPLEEETKRKGKAAIDVICNPLGKSGGATIQQILILVFGSLTACTPYLAGILVVVVFSWLRAATRLGKEYEALKASNDASDIAEANEAKAKLEGEGGSAAAA